MISVNSSICSSPSPDVSTCLKSPLSPSWDIPMLRLCTSIAHCGTDTTLSDGVDGQCSVSMWSLRALAA